MIRGTIAIVGRPNVGKSTIFNRLTRSKKAIVHDMPGMTRDRLYGTVEMVEPDEKTGWDSFILIDTGGFETQDFNFQPFKQNLVWQQTEQAIEAADVVLLVLDGKDGLTPHDKDLVRKLSKLSKEVVYAANKVDGIEQQGATWEFHELGLADIHYCSAAHNRHIWDLCLKLEGALARASGLKNKKMEHEKSTQVAIIGKPNAGKSSILNRLIGEQRALVSDVPGTTRDSVDIELNYKQKHYVFVDTAGIRRKTKIHDKVEGLSVVRSLRVINEADIVVLVIEGTKISDQDAKLASITLNQHKPLLIVVNKWDLVEDKDANTMAEVAEDIRYALKNSSFLPIIFTSALENKRVHKILSEVETLSESYHKRAPTAAVNECLTRAVRSHTPALIRKYNKRVKFFYATQVRTAPPTIVVKCNVAEEIQESYKRYLAKQFRSHLGFGNVPIRVLYRGKSKREEASERDEVILEDLKKKKSLKHGSSNDFQDQATF